MAESTVDSSVRELTEEQYRDELRWLEHLSTDAIAVLRDYRHFIEGERGMLITMYDAASELICIGVAIDEKFKAWRREILLRNAPTSR